MVRIYGSSDDLIYVNGDVNEEFYPTDDSDRDYLSFSNGCVLSIKYDEDGIWRIKPVYVDDSYKKVFEASDADSDKYSDIVEINATIKWVCKGNQYGKSK